MSTHYPDARRAEVTALAIAYGPSGDKRAARESGIPARTIRRWVQLVRSGDARGEAIVSADTREAVAERFWSVVATGARRFDQALADPATPARDVNSIVDTAFRAHSLLTGGPTSRTATVHDEPDGDGIAWLENAVGPLSDDDKRELRDAIDSATARIVEEFIARRLAEPRIVEPAQLGDGRNGS